MAKLVWDLTGERLYETGVKNGVLYVADASGVYGDGVAWNGLVTVTESPTGAEATPIYADDMKYLNIISAEEFEATIEAYTYPDEFMQCDGSAALGGDLSGVFIGQQARKSFGFAYKTTLGNDAINNDYGYKLHILYGCVAAPSEKAYSTINDSPEAITFSWDIRTTPLQVPGFRPTASVVIDSTKVDAATMTAIEDALFGSTADPATILLPEDLIALLTPTVVTPTIVINETAPTIPAGGGTTTLTTTETNMPSGGTVRWSVTGSGWTVVSGLVTAPASVTAGNSETVSAEILDADGTTVLGTPASVTVNIV